MYFIKEGKYYHPVLHLGVSFGKSRTGKGDNYI